MEWYDLFRLPLVLFWVVPAIVVLGVAAMALIVPVVVLAGFGLRVKDLVSRKLRGRGRPIRAVTG